MVSAAGKNIPVFVSPVVVIAGEPTEPAENVATPDTDNVELADNVVNAPVAGVVAPTVPFKAPLVELKEVNVPAAGVVAPTVPFSGPAKPALVNMVPLNVKLADPAKEPELLNWT
jgi:hypothetical protein